MANLTVSATTAAATEQAQIYSRDVYNEPHVNGFWSNLMGEGPNNVIQVNRDLAKNLGDRVNFVLFAELSGAGRVVGVSNTAFSSALEGAEEEPGRHPFGVTLDMIRHQVRIVNKLTEKRVGYEIRPQVKGVLSYWYQRTFFDKMIFRKLSGLDYSDDGSVAFGDTANANTNVVYGGGKATKADLTAADTFEPDLITDAKTMAMTGIFGSTTNWRIRPMIIDGQPYYGCVLHPYQRADLRKHPDWKSAQQEARERALSNPIFSGALAVWDGVILYEHDNVVTGSDAGGGNVAYADALFFGLQAGLLAEAQDGIDWVEKWFEYGTSWGVSIGAILGFQKTRFNSKDFAVIKIETAAKNPRA